MIDQVESTDQARLLELIRLKFSSGNNIDVERITLTRKEVEDLTPELLNEQSRN